MLPLRPTLAVLSPGATGAQSAGMGVRTGLRIAFEASDPHAAPLAAAVRAYVAEALAFGLKEDQIVRALRLHTHQVGCDVPEPELAEVLAAVEATAECAFVKARRPALTD